MSAKAKKPESSSQSVVNQKSRFTALSACFGDPPLLDGEDKAAYESLSTQIEAAVEPKDAIECLWVRDVIDLTWEIQRLRRLKTAYLAACAPEGLTSLLQRNFYGYEERQKLVSGWTYREEEQVTAVQEILETCNLPQEAIAAETFAKKIDDIEKMDRMIASAEARRLNIIREVDRHREAFARQLRDAADIKDAEFTVLGDGVSEAAE